MFSFQHIRLSTHNTLAATALAAGENRVERNVQHRRWEDGEDSRVSREHPFVEDAVVLLHPSCQRDVVVLCEAPERVQQEHGFLEPTGQQLLVGVLHEQRVTVVDRVAELESVPAHSRRRKTVSLSIL